MDTLPARTRDYIGPVTDTRVYDSFELPIQPIDATHSSNFSAGEQ